MSFTLLMRQTPTTIPPDYPVGLRVSPAILKLTDVSMRILMGLLEAAQIVDTDRPPPDFDAVWPPDNLDPDLAADMLELWLDADADERPVGSLPGTSAEQTLARAAFERIAALNADHGADMRIPAYKFGSPDGWTVTAAECMQAGMRCRSVADALAGEGSDDGRQMRLLAHEFGLFCLLASKHGGFRVW